MRRPGSSRFYLSLEDDLMRIFGSDRISGLMGKLGMEEDQPIEHKWVTKAIETSQRRVEAHHFDIRKHLLEYDDVNNKQRTEIYSFRREILAGDNLKERVLEMAENALDDTLAIYCPEDKHPEEWDEKALREAMYGQFAIYPEIEIESYEDLRSKLLEDVVQAYEKKEQEIGEETFRYLEKMVLLQVVDVQWKDHLLSMDHLKEGVGLRGYGQRDPLVEYKREAFEIFEDLSGRVASETIARLMRIQIAREDSVERQFEPRPSRMTYGRGSTGGGAKPQTVVKDKKIGRNDPCTCGSGKKYKKCCGTNA
jgi:preprotein translocase subunit SecA